MKTEITELLGIEYPVIQGGMAWVAECHLAAAVSNAGGLGLIAAGGAPAEWVREQIRETKKLTDKPFGVNIMLMNPESEKVAKVIVEEGVKVVTTGAGSPEKYMADWKAAGVKVIPVVASVALAKRMERCGADAVVAEGTEAGGHIGELTTMVLVPQVVDARKHKRRVRDYIYMMVKDNDVADDIFQETFIKVIRVIDEGRYTDNGKFLSWVLRIAHNQVIDHFRACKQNKQVNESESGYNVLGSLRFAEKTIEDELISSQIESDVRNLIELLPEEQREVVMMRYYSGMSFKEIAEQTGVSINTALGRMRYALINLRRMIREKELILS